MRRSLRMSLACGAAFAGVFSHVASPLADSPLATSLVDANRHVNSRYNGAPARMGTLDPVTNTLVPDQLSLSSLAAAFASGPVNSPFTVNGTITGGVGNAFQVPDSSSISCTTDCFIDYGFSGLGSTARHVRFRTYVGGGLTYGLDLYGGKLSSRYSVLDDAHGNMFIGGDGSTIDLFTSPPSQLTAFASAPYLSVSPASGHQPGDTMRAALATMHDSVVGPTAQEASAWVEMRNKTGGVRYYANGKTYAKDEFMHTVDGAQTYIVTQAGTTAADTGPASRIGPTFCDQTNPANQCQVFNLVTNAAQGGSRTTLSFASTSGLAPNMYANGPGIPVNDLVTAVTGNSVTLASATTSALAAGTSVVISVQPNAVTGSDGTVGLRWYAAGGNDGKSALLVANTRYAGGGNGWTAAFNTGVYALPAEGGITYGIENDVGNSSGRDCPAFVTGGCSIYALAIVGAGTNLGTVGLSIGSTGGNAGFDLALRIGPGGGKSLGIDEESSAGIGTLNGGTNAIASVRNGATSPYANLFIGSYSQAVLDTQSATTPFSLRTKAGQKLCLNGSADCLYNFSDGNDYFDLSAQLLIRSATPTTAKMVVQFTTPSISPTTGALQSSGGLGVVGDSYLGGLLNVAGQIKSAVATASSSPLTGSIVGAGGLGIAGDSYLGGILNVVGSITGASLSTSGAATVGSLSTSGTATVGGLSTTGAATIGNLSTSGIGSIGTLKTGTYTGTACTNAGYITILDSTGTSRKVQICA